MIIIKGKPVAKNRPRFAKRGKIVVAYSDQETESGKAYLQILEQVRGVEPLTGALFVEISFFIARPKSHFGTGKNSGRLKPSSPKYHTKKPDVDNYIKFYFDVMNELVWRDDSQVVSVKACKKYCGPGEIEKTQITIETIKE